jgi:hypothetical protein
VTATEIRRVAALDFRAVHRPRIRWLAAGLVAVTTLATVATAAMPVGAVVRARSGPKIKTGHACSILSAKQVAKALGSPTAVDPHQLLPAFCTMSIGADPTRPPGGVFAVGQIFPSLFASYADARAAVDDEHAVGGLAGDDLEDVSVGKTAFIDHTSGKLVVEASKKFAFTLQWWPAPSGTKITRSDVKKLVKLAKLIVPRAPR